MTVIDCGGLGWEKIQGYQEKRLSKIVWTYLTVAFKGPNVILGLYKCNYSLTRGKELSAAAG